MKIRNIVTVLLVSIILVSCAPAVKVVPTETAIPISTFTPNPPITPFPTITSTPIVYLSGLNHIPAPDNTFIEKVITENYLKVFGITREQVNLIYAEHTAINGENFVVMLDETTGVPIAVYTGEWEQATLKFFGKQVGIMIGTDVLGYNNVHSNFAYINQYETATLETYWLEQETPNGKDNSDLPFQIEWITSKGITEYTVHCMLFPGYQPEWLLTGNYNQDELRIFMKARIDSVIRNAPNASIYVVVNEPYLSPSINPDRAQYDIFYPAWGYSYEYIKEAFQYAREALNKAGRPDAKLMYNDGDNHYSIGQSSAVSRQIVTMLYKEGLIDYVGMQMHIGEWKKGAFDNLMVSGIPAELEFYKKLGVPVLITELTYTPSEEELKLDTEEFNNRLSHVFTTIFNLAIESGNVEQITFWSLTDLHLTEVSGDYQIFDKEGHPKKAFYEVLRTLYEHIP